MGASGIGSKGIIGSFYHTLSQLTGSDWVGQVSMYFDSNQEIETYKFLGQVPQMREWIGGRHAKGLRENGLSIRNVKYESTLEIDVDEARRDKTGQIQVRINEQARRALSHWAKLLSLYIDAGDGTTYGNSYTGSPFFSTSHSVGDSGTWKNKLTSTEVSDLNISAPAAPTPQEYSTAIFSVVAYLMENIKDDQGELINEDATKWHILCPNAQQWTAAAQAVANDKILDASGNTVSNPLATQDEIDFSVSFVPRLTSFNGFYIFRTDTDVKPFIRQEELGIQMSAVAEGSELEFENDVWHFGIKALRNVGYGYPEFAAMCTFD